MTISCYTHVFLFQCNLLNKYLEICFSQKWPRNSRSLLQRWKEAVLPPPMIWRMVYKSKNAFIFFKDYQEIKVRRFTRICQLHIASNYSVLGYSHFCFLFSFFWNNPFYSSISAPRFSFSVFSLYFCLMFCMPAENLWGKNLKDILYLPNRMKARRG